ncbi:glycosyl hydrolase family 28-related protein [Burkholderia gladioli]|uniref:glycosyl hydrolase family 28-related protein n=1 Tax=Burkholderia gladioli TaxID=28095 RepID=UPI001640B5C8|nr:right-handed parallel beta-helix repeat-containing protein [Burkholderia gladioli]
MKTRLIPVVSVVMAWAALGATAAIATTPGDSPGAPAAAVAQPANSLNVADYGAIGDGRSDCTQAMQNAFNTAASQHRTAYIPAGTYLHSAVLTLGGVTVTGAGAQTILVASNPDQEALQLTGSATLSNLVTSTRAPNRSSQPLAAAIDVTGANNRVEHVTTLGAASNGIRLDGASGAQIVGNLVEGSNADGIALMNGSLNDTVDSNEVYQAGDDSYSDDSYTFDSRQDSGNLFTHDYALANAYGRGFALMGATGDTIRNSVTDGSQWMGIVAGTDSNSRTMNGSNDTIADNLILNAKGDAVAVMSAGGGLSQGGAGMRISGNVTSGSAASVLGFTPATNLVDRVGARVHAGHQPGRPQHDQQLPARHRRRFAQRRRLSAARRAVARLQSPVRRGTAPNTVPRESATRISRA